MKRKLSVVLSVFFVIVVGLVLAGYFYKMKSDQNEETENEFVEDTLEESLPEEEGSPSENDSPPAEDSPSENDSPPAEGSPSENDSPPAEEGSPPESE